MDGIILGLLLPFVGTSLGASCVYLMKREMRSWIMKSLTGFAAGVMVAASVWSLLIPAIEMSGEGHDLMAVLPATCGFCLGIFFLLLLDRMIPHQHVVDGATEGPRSKLSKASKLVLAVTLHNIPEGMAIGVTLAAAMEHNSFIPMAAALALSLGIAIQNFPEGAIVSMPLRGSGVGKGKAFLLGVASGAVEPIAAGLTIVFASAITAILPYMLSFAAGAMIYVVVEELIPETQQGHHSNIGTIGFAVGFSLMMVLDVVLG